MKPGLTEKQKRFVDYYIETGNAAEAARLAGYKSRNADVIGRENLRKPTVRKALDTRLKEIDEARIADAKEVMIHLTAVLRGEQEGEELVCVGTGNGLSKPVKVMKRPSIREQIEAAKCLMKRYGLMLSDIEKEEKQARTDALKKEMYEQNEEEKVMILDNIPDTDSPG